MDAAQKSPRIILRDLPADIYKVIIREQAKEKEKRGTSQYSLSTTVIKIIRDWEKCKQQ